MGQVYKFAVWAMPRYWKSPLRVAVPLPCAYPRKLWFVFYGNFKCFRIYKIFSLRLRLFPSLLRKSVATQNGNGKPSHSLHSIFLIMNKNCLLLPILLFVSGATENRREITTPKYFHWWSIHFCILIEPQNIKIMKINCLIFFLVASQ